MNPRYCMFLSSLLVWQYVFGCWALRVKGSVESMLVKPVFLCSCCVLEYRLDIVLEQNFVSGCGAVCLPLVRWLTAF